MDLSRLARKLALLILGFPVLSLAANSISIESPMPGSVVKAGTVLNIAWSTEGTIPDVDIDLSTDDGATWRPMASYAENRGSYTCFIPYFTAPKCRIRVADSDGTAEDVSGTFSLLAGTLSIDAPKIDSFSVPVMHGEETIVPVWLVNSGEALVLLNSARIYKSTLPGIDWLGVAPILPAFIRPGDSLAFPIALNKGGIISADAALQATIEIIHSSGTDTAEIKINTRVRSSNLAPFFTTISLNEEVAENAELVSLVRAEDPDGQIPMLSAFDLPSGAEFVDNQNGSGELTWQTDFSDAGDYSIIIVASDGSLADSAVVHIHVTNGNRRPELTLVGHQYVTALKTLSFDISATDPDNEPLRLEVYGLPDNATFVPHGDNTATFTFTPDLTQVGELSVGFGVKDAMLDGEGGLVYISVDPAAPLSVTTCDACSPGSPSGDILTNDPIVIVFSHALNEASLAGRVSLVSHRDGPLEFSYLPVGRSLVVKPSHAEFSPLDTIDIVISSGITSWTNELLKTDYIEQVLTGPIVYPGDLDNNGVVDERDILPIGAFFGQTGPSRLRYDAEDYPRPEPAHRWASLAVTYADANGSGKVDVDDICYVSQYWGWHRQEGNSDGRQTLDLASAGLDDNRVANIRAALSGCPPSMGKQALLEALGGGEAVAEENLPATTELFANYPNPFNPTTTISFQLAAPARVRLTIINLMGQTVRTLIDDHREAGVGQIEWNGADESGNAVASGVYFYRIEAGEFAQTRRLLLLK